MKKMVKMLACGVLAAGMALGSFALTGCGNKTRSDPNTLWLTVQDTQAELAIHVKLGNAFAEKMKEQGQEITVRRSTFSNNDYGKSILTLLNTQSLGDVVFTYDTYASQYSKEGLFEDLSSYVERDIDLSLYNEDVIESARAYENQLSYFPRSYDMVTVFINNQFFRDVGMEDRIPSTEIYGENWENWTWSAMLDLLKDLRVAINQSEKYGGAKSSYYYPVDANIAWNAVYDSVIKSFGGYTVNAENMTSGLDSAQGAVYENTLRAIQFMKDLVEEKTEYAEGVEGRDDKTKRALANSSEGTFSSGNDAMAFMTRPSVQGCKEADMDLSFAPMPKFDAAVTGLENGTTYVGYGSGGYALYKDSANKELAWEFIRFAVSEEGQEIIAEDGLCIPTIKSLQTSDAAWTEYLPGVDQSAFLFEGNTLSLATYARGVEQETEYQIYSKIKQSMMSALLDPDKTPANVASSLYNAIKNYIK